MKKRILSLLLCLCMAAALPGMALAAEAVPDPGTVVLDVSTVGTGKSIVITKDGYSAVPHSGGDIQALDDEGEDPPMEGLFKDLTLTGTGEGIMIIVASLPDGGSLTLENLEITGGPNGDPVLNIDLDPDVTETPTIHVKGSLTLTGEKPENGGLASLLSGDVSLVSDDGGDITLTNSGAPVWDANHQAGGSLRIADAGDVNINGGGNDTCALWGSPSGGGDAVALALDDEGTDEAPESVVDIAASGKVTIHNVGLAPAIFNVDSVNINAGGDVTITNTPGEEPSVARSLRQEPAVLSDKLFITSDGKVTINGIDDYTQHLNGIAPPEDYPKEPSMEDFAKMVLTQVFRINAASGVDLTMMDGDLRSLCIHNMAITSDSGSVIFREPDWEKPGDGMILMKDGKPNIAAFGGSLLLTPDGDAAMLKDIPVWMAGEGTVTFDLSGTDSAKVTLDNATFDNASIPAEYRGSPVFALYGDSITLELKGENTVNFSMDGVSEEDGAPPALVLGGDVTITGTGSLDVTGGTVAIDVEGKLTVASGTVTALGTECGINIYGDPTGLVVSGGTVTAQGDAFDDVSVVGTLTVAENAVLNAELISYYPSETPDVDRLSLPDVDAIVVTGSNEGISATVYGTVEMSGKVAALLSGVSENSSATVIVPEGAALVVPAETAEVLLGNDSTVTITNNGALVIPDEYKEDNVTSGDTAMENPCVVVVSANPPAGGTVTGGGAYEAGASVTVTAAPKAGYVFDKWTENGETVSTDARYTFTAEAGAKNLVAVFEPKVTVTVSASPAEGGRVAGGGDYKQGVSVTVTATANSGYTFTKWTKNGADAGTSASYTFTAESDTALTAVFTKQSTGGDSGNSGSSGGGGGGGSSSDDSGSSSTRNPDGSTTTKTENKTTGTVTETTRHPDGSQIVVETRKDGSVTTTGKAANGTTATVTTDASGKTEATVDLSAKAVSNAAGRTVTLPMTGVSATRSAETAPVVTVNTGSSDPVKVEIPTSNVTPGTVAVIVKADGTEEIVKSSVATEKGVAVSLSDGATVKIVENSKAFADVPANNWAADAVSFSSARELFSGTSEATFSPDEPMTRAMMVTVLARFDGEDTAGGATWYEKGVDWAVANGVSDGANPNSNITREQLVTMLWRYAGSPSASGSLSRFTDAGQTSSFAQEAMSWAVENGIINGYGSGQLGPQGDATRAQVAQMLKNFIER